MHRPRKYHQVLIILIIYISMLKLLFLFLMVSVWDNFFAKNDNFCFCHGSSTTGPILCGKPILRSTVPSYCPLHFQKAEKHMVRALKKAGLNVTSTSKLAPKFHVIVAEYVRQIQYKRRAAQRANLENPEIKEENHYWWRSCSCKYEYAVEYTFFYSLSKVVKKLQILDRRHY